MRLIDKNTHVLVQGITGSQGHFHTKLMLDYGTKVVAGVTPGKGGTTVEGIPVFDTIDEAKLVCPIDASIIFVPARFALDPALEAIESDMDPVVIITENIPIRDSMEIMATARLKGTTIIGPNTSGLIKPEESKMGIMPSQIFKKGSISIISRSGTLFYEVAAHITNTGYGQSICIGLGGDPIVGLDFIDVLKWLEVDDDTLAVALIGEIGGNAEENAAEFISQGRFTKPVVAYIAGRSAIPGKRMGHAGAIIHGEAGTAQSKIQAMRDAGIAVGEQPGDLAKFLKQILI